MGNTTKGAPFPDLTDPANGPDAVQQLAQWVDARPGVSTLSYAAINALSGADLWAGRLVYQSDTGTNRPVAGLYEFDGVDWRSQWNQPWGELAYADVQVNQTGIGASMTDIAALTVTKTIPANRIIWVRAELIVAQVTADGTATVILTDSSNNRVHALHSAPATAGSFIDVRGARRLLGLSGSIGFKVRATTTAGSLTSEAGDGTTSFGPAFITVEDRGPSGAPD